MDTRRKIVIDVKNRNVKREVVNYIKTFNNQFSDRKVDIIYRINRDLNSNINAKLYGYDNKIKSQTSY